MVNEASVLLEAAEPKDLLDAIQDGYWMLSTKNWPEHYLFIEDDRIGNARCKEGNPGPQGQWKIKKLEDGSFTFYNVHFQVNYLLQTSEDDRNC